MSVAQFRVCASWVLCKCHSPFRVSETRGHAKAWTPNSAVQVYGPNARPKLDVEAFHEPRVRCPPFRVSETRGHAKAWTPNSAVPVHGPNARPKLEVQRSEERRVGKE